MRRPKPLEQRIGEGNPGKRPLPDAPERVAGEPVMPAHYKGHAQDCWHYYAEILRQRGQLSMESRLSFEGLCECYAEWRELHDDVRKNGRVQRVRTVASARTKDADGSDESEYLERQRPQVSMLADADRRLKAWLVEFGLTDASRGKVSAKEKSKTEDDLSEYGLN
jgi:P27 family predicted phage terminase small subunit